MSETKITSENVFGPFHLTRGELALALTWYLCKREELPLDNYYIRIQAEITDGQIDEVVATLRQGDQEAYK